MWLPISFLLLAGIVAADYDHGWKLGNEYHYLVRSRTFTGMDEPLNQYSGIIIKAILTVQPTSPETLRAKLSKAQYAHVHQQLQQGWESEISDQMLDLKPLPISNEAFEMKLKHGVIRELIVNKETPNWEVNIMKSIISQLQVDTQGDNAVKSRRTQVPDENEPYASFKAMEDSVGGKCEVLYDIVPLSDYTLHRRPELVPIPELKGNGHHIDIMKTKNYENCAQRMGYHFGLTGNSKWEPGSNRNGEFLSRSSTSRIIISGNLKQFTIQSSVTTNQMHVSLRFYETEKAMVLSRMNLTLASVKKISNTLPRPSNPESAGNLVYTYNAPFLQQELRKAGDMKHDPNVVSDSVSSVSSSEEQRVAGAKRPKYASDQSASDSSSSISSSEENDFWQRKPTLDGAPDNPLLPYFVGYKGKAIGMSDAIDPVTATNKLVLEIANELEDPSSMPSQETLEKFTMLTSLIRTMSRKQISEAEGNMRFSPDELKAHEKSHSKKQNAWHVFRDAVALAGTGPALMTIKDWIDNKRLQGYEASEVISQIPKSARTPTSEYIQTLFEMVRDEQVMQQNFVNTSVVLAFAELVRQVQVNGKDMHNQYPVHTFGRLSPKRSQMVTEEYIPYLARQLKKAMKEDNSPKIQTYILALGNIGHPKILSVYEPYLEGKEPVSVFQRMMMVASLSKLADLQPRLARSVLYKIYLNTMEAHEVRCTAVFLLMKTDPPLNMLQRMAEFTNQDTNKHVNSAVKSSIISLAKMKRPAVQELAERARAVRKLLTPQEYNYQYSQGLIEDSVMEYENLAYKFIAKYVGSDDSSIPLAWYMGLATYYGDFRVPDMEIASMISSIKSFRDIKEKSKSKQDVKSATDKIAEALNIVPGDSIKPEGNILFNSPYGNEFYPFDGQLGRRYQKLIQEYMRFLKESPYNNMNKILSYEVALSFPTETGLPFIYTLKAPLLLRYSGEEKFDIDGLINGKLKSSFGAVSAMKVQGRAGFVTPFEHQQFITGTDVNVQIYLPMNVELNYDTPNQKLELKILGKKGEKDARLLHYSVIPYTSRHDILNMSPVVLSKNTQRLLVEEPKTLSHEFPDKMSGIWVSSERDEREEDSTSDEDEELLPPFFLLWSSSGNAYRKMDVHANMELIALEPVTIATFFDTMQVDSETDYSPNWEPKAKAIEPSDKQVNSKARRQQYLKEAAKGINSASSYVVELQLEAAAKERMTNTLSIAWANSNVDEKSRILAYWHVNIPQWDVVYEVCAAAQATQTPKTILKYESAVQTKPKANYDFDIRFGESCMDNSDGRLDIKVKEVQSDEFRQNVKQSQIVKKCQEQMKLGNKALRACKQAGAAILSVDEYELSLDLPSKTLKSVTDKAVDITRKTAGSNVRVDVSDPKNAGSNKLDIKAKFSNNFETSDISVHTSKMDVTFPNIDTSSYTQDWLSLISTSDNMETRELIEGEDQFTCVLDNNQAETFDGKSFGHRLGNCWHVIMTTYPVKNPENPKESLPIPADRKVSILAREGEDGQKEVKVILGDNEIRFSSSENQLRATVDGQRIRYSQRQSYQHKDKDGDVDFEIFELEDHSIRLMSDTYDVDVVYDGRSIQLKATDKYRSSVRGLCGNFDGDPANDFIAPKNCLMMKPEEFIASYALTKDECQGPSMENARKLDKSVCIQPKVRTSNVISDHEAGRFNSESRKWGYHTEEPQDNKNCNTYRTKVRIVDDKICFTNRPVPSCAPGCSPTEMKTKNYQLHCMPKGSAATEMMKRVEKGANPDFSQKPVSLTQPMEVPLACAA